MMISQYVNGNCYFYFIGVFSEILLLQGKSCQRTDAHCFARAELSITENQLDICMTLIKVCTIEIRKVTLRTRPVETKRINYSEAPSER